MNWASAYPSTVILDTTNVCNARCPFCPLFHGDSQFDRVTRPARVMAQNVYATLLREIALWPKRPDALIHSANGKIFQDPKVLDRLAVLKETGLGSVAVLLTNGQYLSEPIAKATIDAGIGELIIGFDGASKEVYEAHRVRCNFERVLDNVRSFVRLRAAMEGRTRVWIKFVRTLRNAHEVEAAFRLFSDIMDPELDRFQDALAVDWADNGTNTSDLYYVYKVKEGRRRASCTYFDTGLMIHPDGIVGACCWDYNLNISAGGFGDVSETPILDIWRSQQRLDLGVALTAGTESELPEKCKTCIILHESEPIREDLHLISRDHLEATSDTTLIYRFPQTAPARGVSIGS